MRPRHIIISILLLCSVSCCLHCSKEAEPEKITVAAMDFDTISFVPSMKGWELYSWPNGNNFNHSLLPGTNRLKSYDEVVCNRYVVYGTDSLKMLLGRIPENEPIFWIGKGWLNQCWQDYYKGDLRLPDLFTIKAIQKFCSENNLVLEISD